MYWFASFHFGIKGYRRVLEEIFPAQGIRGGHFARAFWLVIPVHLHFLVLIVVSLLRADSIRKCV
jgi:hypothetical protein